MRAKFRVNSVKEFAFGRKEAELSAVFSNNPEDNEFAKATPNGTITITIDNPATRDFLVPGKTYYVDFSTAE